MDISPVTKLRGRNRHLEARHSDLRVLDAPSLGPASGPFAVLQSHEDDRAGRIAQLVEQLTLNQRVQGSSPCAPTNLFNRLGGFRVECVSQLWRIGKHDGLIAASAPAEIIFLLR